MKGTVVVTGGAGFVGSHMVALLLSEGYMVHVVDSFVEGKEEEYLHADAQYHNLDVRSTDALMPLLKDAQFVFHMAALPSVQYSIEFPVETDSVNVGGTLSVLEALRRSQSAARVVLMSSASCYGEQDVMPLHEGMRPQPLSPYALHKLHSEQLMQLWNTLYGIQTVSLRCFNIYGPRMRSKGAYASAIGTFLAQHAAHKPLTVVGDGSQTRDFVHVRDVARTNLLAARSEAVGKGEVLNIGSGIETSVRTIAELVGGEVVYLPPRVEPQRSVADITRAHSLLQFVPSVSFADGIDELKKLTRITI